jgi:signal peptidase II
MQQKFYFLILGSLILIDQLSKLAVSKLGWSIFLNDQFAFSLPVPIVLMFAIYLLVLSGSLFYIYKFWKNFSSQQKLAWTLVVAGGLSNVVERIFLGSVRDFIPLAGGMLNFADFYILIGLVLLLVSTRSQDPTQ